MRTVLFHNPKAGTGQHPKKDLISALGLRDWSIVYCSTKDDEFDDVLRRSADLFIVAGGDGTVAKVVTHMPDRSIPVALFPLGTANNIARSLGISGSPIELAEALSVDRCRRLNIGLARGPWGRRRFLEAVGLGPLAKAIDVKVGGKSAAANKIHKGRRALQKRIREATPLDIEVLVDTLPLAHEVVALEVLNITYVGPALPLAAGADPGDRKLDVVSITARQTEDVATWLTSPHESLLAAKVCHGREIIIKGDLPAHKVDDDVFEAVVNETITIEVEHEPVKVLVP
jgi:diacylglycerol kinase (ATP)